MSRKQYLILFLIIFYLATDISYAAPIIYRKQRMQAMQQQEEQEEYEQQQAQQQQGQQGAPGQGQAPAPLTYQQQIDQRNQAIAQAIQDAHNQSVSSQNLQTGNGTVVQPVAPQTGPSSVKDVVDLSEVWKKLDTRSTIWSAIVDDQSKLLTVSEYIDRFQKEGVKIQAPPAHYVQEIDQIVTQNPQMLQRPFGELLQIAAIVDYDFDNGMDKDLLAKKVLGEAGFEANKKRFEQAQQQHQQGGGPGA